jgi:hypothetical protein
MKDIKLECVNCGGVFDSNINITFIEIDGEQFCDECVSKCLECGEYHLTDDMTYVDNGGYVCDNCLNKHYTQCFHCDEWVQTDCTYYIDSEDDRVCEDCYCDSYGSCEDCGWTTHIDNLCYSERDDCTYCEDCYNEHDKSNNTFSYHSGKGRDNLTGGYRYAVGVELEREDEYFKDEVDKYDLLDKTGWVMEEDASLDYDWGFEAVSPIYPLKIGYLDELFSKGLLNQLINTSYSDNCGGHMTVSDKYRTPDELIDDMAGYLPMIYALFPKRTANHYCEPKNKNIYKQAGRYALSKRGSYQGSGLEFRIFDPPRDKEDLMNRFRLLKYMLSHKATTVEQGLQELSDSDRLRKIVKTHLDTYNITYKEFYSNIVRYARDIDDIMLEIRPDEVEEILNK